MLLYEFFLRWVVLTLQLNLFFDIVLNIWQSWKLNFLMLQVNCHFHWQPTTIQKLWRKHPECSWYPVTTLIAKLCLTTKEFDGKKSQYPKKNECVYFILPMGEHLELIAQNITRKFWFHYFNTRNFGPFELRIWPFIKYYSNEQYVRLLQKISRNLINAYPVNH